MNGIVLVAFLCLALVLVGDNLRFLLRAAEPTRGQLVLTGIGLLLTGVAVTITALLLGRAIS